MVFTYYHYSRIQIPLSAKKGSNVTSSAIVALNVFLDSLNLPKQGLSGLKGIFFGMILKLNNLARKRQKIQNIDFRDSPAY